MELARDAVEFSTAKDQGNVTFQLSHGDSGNEQAPFDPKTLKTTYFTSWSLTLKAPLDKKEADTELATLDGLSDAFIGTLKYNRISVTRRNPDDAELGVFCDLEPDEKAPSGKPPCDLGEAKKVLSEAGYIKLHGLYFGPNQYAWGGAVTAGTQSYEFLLKDSIDKETSHRTPWSAQVFVGWQRYRIGLITLAYRYEDAYKAGKATTLCPLSSSTAFATCMTAPLGAPKKEEKSIATVEFRRSTTMWGKPIGFSPSLNYEAHESVLGIDLPIYLWSDGKRKLTGGFKAGWRDDEGGVSFGLFIGVPFTLAP